MNCVLVGGREIKIYRNGIKIINKERKKISISIFLVALNRQSIYLISSWVKSMPPILT